MFATLHDEIDGLTLGDKSRSELRRLLSELHRVVSRATEARLSVLAELDSLDDDGPDAASEARAATGCSARAAKRDAATAETLREMPAAAESLAAGQITIEHAERLADAARETSPEDAAELIDVAEQVPADLFARRASRWLGARRSADDAEERHQRQRRDRELAVWNEAGGTGSLVIHGQMDSATGRDFEATLQAKVEELWRADGGRDGSPDQVRTPAQRRLDALVELVLASGEAGSLPHVKHIVHLVITAETGHAEFLDGQPVPPSYLEHLDTASAQIVAHVADGKGRPLWLGRRKRLASVDQWLHLIVRDRGCTDCDAGPAHCEAHHVSEWNEGGPTDVDNLELKCHNDHGLAHRKTGRRNRGPRQAWDASAEAIRGPTRRPRAA